MSRRVTLLLLCALTLGALGPPHPAQAAALAGAHCFEATGFCMAGPIARFWERNGGLAVFGLPIGPLLDAQIEGRSVQAQWFERTRLELHPTNPAPFDVQLGRVGVEALAADGRDWRSFAPAPAQPGCHFFAQTGQSVCGAILAAWQAQGIELDGQTGVSPAESLALFGLPLSPPHEELLADGQLHQVQWFERARFELHPANPPEAQVLLGLLGSALRPLSSGAPLPQLGWGECPFDITGLPVDCGTLIVPADWGQPSARSVALAFAVFRDPHPAPDPIIYLAGGPGSPALEHAPALYRAWHGFVAGRDLVVLDQRGSGFSWPSLRCPELSDFAARARAEDLTGLDYVRGEATTLLDCRNRIETSGARMAHVTSAASATDVAALRAALGYSQWNLLGISYGSRLALTVLRTDPTGVRSAVLDSVYPTQANLYTSMPANLNWSLRTLFADCAADPGCNAAYPDLAATFDQLVDDLNANPPTVNLSGVPFRLTGDRLVGLMFRLLYSSALIPRLPQMIDAAHRGDYGPLQALTTQRAQSSGSLAQASYDAIQCAEDLAYSTPAALAGVLAEHPRLAGFYAGLLETSPAAVELCIGFGAAPPDPRTALPVVSSVPTLLLAGAYDPITPPEWREQAAATLSVSHGYTLPGTGHAVIGRGACPVALIRAFLAAPAQPPEHSCIAQLGPPAFAH